MCAGFCHAIVSLLANNERIGALRDSKARSKERQLVSALECGQCKPMQWSRRSGPFETQRILRLTAGAYPVALSQTEYKDMMTSDDQLRPLPSCVLLCIAASMAFGSVVIAQGPISKTVEVQRDSVVEVGEGDNDKLQGNWQIVSIEIQGKVIKREDELDAWRDAFAKDVIVDGDRFTHALAAANAATIKLDDTRDPKQITIQDEEEKLKFRGIYAINGENVVLCINGDGTDVRRPEEFVTKEGKPLILVTLKKSPKPR